MKKTKIMALLLALVMAFSLMAVPVSAASVELGVGTVVLEKRSGEDLVHVFMEDKTVVTFGEEFFLEYTSTTAAKSREFSSRGGYVWLVEAALDRVARDKAITRAKDGKSCNYSTKVIRLATTGEALPVDYIVTNYFQQPATKAQTLDTVSYTVVYRNGKKSVSYITVESYGDGPVSSAADAYCDIWTVRELDAETIEVYLRNGMVVTLKKAMIVDWVDSRPELGRTFGLSEWHDWWEMTDDGAATAVEYCPMLLDALVCQGWTTYPTDLFEVGYGSYNGRPGYGGNWTDYDGNYWAGYGGRYWIGYGDTYKDITAKNVMRKGLTSDAVLVKSMERLRNADTTSEVTIYFNYSDYRGNWLSSSRYLMSFEFICYDRGMASGSNFYALTRPEYFLWSFNTVKEVWLTDKEIGKLRR